MYTELISEYAETEMNIAQACLRRHAQGATAKRTAMVFVANDLTHTSFTYEKLDELSSRFAQSLKARGLKPGDRVLLRLPNTFLFPTAFFGAIRGGFIPVPTSPMLTAGEFAYLAENSEAAALVTDSNLFAPLVSAAFLSGLKAVYAGGGDGTISVESDLAATEPGSEIYPRLGRDPAYLVYTSGTTGYPKGVLHSQQALLGRLPAATHWFDFTPDGDDRILHSGKFNWTYVLGTALMDPLYHGKTVVVYEGENSPERWIEIIRQHNCNIFIGVPTIFRQILQKTAAGKAAVPMLRHAMCAGEHLTDEVLQGWIERFGFPIYEGLGMSECSYYISQRPGDRIKPNSAGKIQPGHRAHLLDENLEPVRAGEEGMLCIHRSDPGLFLEYWRAPEANEKQFIGGWFLTGDYARSDDEGYIFFLGRRDEIIKSFGYRVSPFEIERVYRDYPGLDDAVAFAEALGPEKTLISLCVQMKPGGTFDESALAAFGRIRLASYKLPKKFYALEKFPRSANGKVLRSRIPKLLRLDGA